jgi:tetratricopeptide (TPR) repeat protein
MQRARKPGIRPELREGGFIDAVGDFDYVVRNATPDFILLPEVYLRLGEAYAELGNTAAALQAYEESARRKPDYWPAYVNAAQIYERVGLKKQALARIADGLKAAPQQPILQQHYKRLGGDLTAFMKTLPAPTPVAASASAPAAEGTPR